ncbi:MAG: VWA domain-containing protein [Thermoanaerobaculia bacterium]
MTAAAALVALFTFPIAGIAQESPRPFAEQIEVSAVLIDAIVTDRSGRQILGLSKDDFVVTENGVEQKVDSIGYYTNLQLLDAREESAPFQVERIREPRTFVFFFDKPEDPGVLWDRIMRAREAARNFIETEMAPDDRIAIVGHDRRLKIYSDFTSDKSRLKRALNDVSTFGRGVMKGGTGTPSILGNISSDALMMRTGTVYEALDKLADALRPIRGRKTLVLFSPGIRDLDETLRDETLVSRSRHLDPMLESLNAANVAVYPVQIQRETVTAMVAHQRLEEIAGATGGEYFRMNMTFDPALDKIENGSNGYYLITYQSRRPKGSRGFQKVDVSVRNSEFRVVARPGYPYGD